MALTLAVAALGRVAAVDTPVIPAPASLETITAPKVIRSVAAQYPPTLMQQLVSGDAVIECLIAVDGHIVESVVLSSTHPDFGVAALEAVRQWKFKAGKREGQPIEMRVAIPLVFQLAPELILEVLARRPLFVDVNETIVPAEQLPKWPLPKKYWLPNYPPSLVGSGKHGKAVVAIVINKEGLVINPKIVKSTYPEFDLPARRAASILEFPPQIMANKEAIYVSMDIQFDFVAEGAKAKPSAAEKSLPNPAGKKTP